MSRTIDPVCGAELEREEAEADRFYSDCEMPRTFFSAPGNVLGTRRFFFCSTECKSKFDIAPGFYSNLAVREQPPEQQRYLPI